MKLLVAVLGGCLAVSAPALAAAPSQPLSIRVQGDGAQATRLAAYDPAVPIAITVTNSGAHIDALSIVATGPAGESMRIPLSRIAGETFSGSLTLDDPGAWRLQLTSQTGALHTGMTPVPLNVAVPSPSDAAAVGFAVGAGMFIVIGGSGFLVLRRFSAPAGQGFERAV
jgi:hypothetical protein